MINLIADKSSERLLYILEVIFKTVLKTPYRFVDLSVNSKFNESSGEAILNYSSANIPGSFRIPNAGLLFEENIKIKVKIAINFRVQLLICISG